MSLRSPVNSSHYSGHHPPPSLVGDAAGVTLMLVAHCKALEACGPIASPSAGPAGPAALLLALEERASTAVTRQHRTRTRRPSRTPGPPHGGSVSVQRAATPVLPQGHRLHRHRRSRSRPCRRRTQRPTLQTTRLPQAHREDRRPTVAITARIYRPLTGTPSLSDATVSMVVPFSSRWFLVALAREDVRPPRLIVEAGTGGDPHARRHRGPGG